MRFVGAGQDALASCDRSICPIFDQDDYKPGCYDPCFTASCDFSRFLCKDERTALKACPLFDATVFASYTAQSSLTFPDPASLRGSIWNASGDGLYEGFGRCVTGSGGGACQLPLNGSGHMTYGLGPGRSSALLLGVSAVTDGPCTANSTWTTSCVIQAGLWAWADGISPLIEFRPLFSVELLFRLDAVPGAGQFKALLSSETVSIGAMTSNGTAVLALSLDTHEGVSCSGCRLPIGSWVHVAIRIAQPGFDSPYPRTDVYINGNKTNFQLPSQWQSFPTAFAGPWGLAIGRFLPDSQYLTSSTHVEDDNATHFNGAIAKLRLWAGEFNVNGSVEGSASCNQQAGSDSLLACFDFNGSLSDYKGVVNLKPRYGDRFRSWCKLREDGGRVLEFLQGAVSDLGEAWGFCTEKESPPPLPSTGYKYDQTSMKALAQMTELEEIVNLHPGCAQIPIIFRGNRAGSKGGGVYRDSCDAGSTRRGTCFVDGNMPIQAASKQVLFSDNKAEIAGGAVYIECQDLGDACIDAVNITVALPMIIGNPPRIYLKGNSAGGWGGDLATAPAKIDFSAKLETARNTRNASGTGGIRRSSMQLPQYIPGQQALNFSVILYDNRSEVVRGSDSVVRVRVCGSVAAGGCSDDASSLVPVPFIPFDPSSGMCTVSGGSPMVCAQDSDSVDVQFSVAGSSIPELVTRVGCRPCPKASSRQVNNVQGSWKCVACLKDQYVMDNNNPAYACNNCPVGAVCDGNDLQGLVAHSVWIADNVTGQFLLESCPPGFELINTDSSTGRFSSDSQECRLCPSGYYCLGGATPRSACPTGTFAPSGANSSAMCGSAIFLDVSVALPMSASDFSLAKQTSFQAALAIAANAPEDRVTIVRIATVRRAGLAATSIQVDSSVAEKDQQSAEVAASSLDSTKLDTQLILQGLPAGTLLSVDVRQEVQSGSSLPVGLIVGLSVAGFVMLFMVFGLALYNALRDKSSPEERQLRQMVLALRKHLGIRLENGFVIGSESIPFCFRSREFVHVQKGQIEAAARALLFQDFDLKQFDGFSLCLEGEQLVKQQAPQSVSESPHMDNHIEDIDPYQKLCHLVLQLAIVLIRPDVCEGDSKDSIIDLPDVNDSLCKLPWQTRDQQLSSGFQTCPLPVERRFRYFMHSLRKVRIWQDDENALFRRLQAIFFEMRCSPEFYKQAFLLLF